MTGVAQRSTAALWLVFLLFSAFATACGGATSSGRSARPVEWQPLGDLNPDPGYPLPRNATFIRIGKGEGTELLAEMLALDDDEASGFAPVLGLLQGDPLAGPLWFIMGDPPNRDQIWLMPSPNPEASLDRVFAGWRQNPVVEHYGFLGRWEFVDGIGLAAARVPNAVTRVDETGLSLVVCTLPNCAHNPDTILRLVSVMNGRSTQEMVDALESQVSDFAPDFADITIFGSGQAMEVLFQVEGAASFVSNYRIGLDRHSDGRVTVTSAATLTVPLLEVPADPAPSWGHEWPFSGVAAGLNMSVDIDWFLQMMELASGGEESGWHPLIATLRPAIGEWAVASFGVDGAMALDMNKLILGFPVTDGVEHSEVVRRYQADCNVSVAGEQEWLPRVIQSRDHLFCTATGMHTTAQDHMQWFFVGQADFEQRPPSWQPGSGALALPPLSSQVLAIHYNPGLSALVPDAAPIGARVAIDDTAFHIVADFESTRALAWAYGMLEAYNAANEAAAP